jgi:hypothetical protein
MGRKKGPSIRTLRRRLAAANAATEAWAKSFDKLQAGHQKAVGSLPIRRRKDGKLELRPPEQWAPGDVAFLSDLGKPPASPPSLPLIEWIGQKCGGIWGPDIEQLKVNIAYLHGLHDMCQPDNFIQRQRLCQVIDNLRGYRSLVGIITSENVRHSGEPTCQSGRWKIETMRT